MHFDPENPAVVQDLCRAVDWSRWRLMPFRTRRLEILSELVGYWYSETGASDRVPVNVLSLACLVYLRQLVSKAPRAMVTTESPALEPYAKDLEAWMNKAIPGMELAESLRLYVLDALLSVGVMKCGAAASHEIQVAGYTQYVGQPFAERVDLDDWVHDISARRLDQCEFMGNRYRVSLDEARECPLFDRVARGRLTAMTRFAYNERGEPRTSTLSQSTLQWVDEYQEHVELWDLWLPREGLVVTLPYSESVDGGFSGPVLRVAKWQGPSAGPYVMLCLGAEVPNNVMPAAPAQGWMDLHLLINRVLRKVGRQSDRQKTITLVAGPNTEDGERLVTASDGDTIRSDRPDAVREVRYGGADRDQMLFHEQLRQIFNVMSGNVEAIGGLSPQAHTLGQDELLSKQSSAQVAEMQDRVQGAARKVYNHLAYWWHTDPHATYSASRRAHGVGVSVSIPPQVRSMPFESLGIDIDPYTMQDDTPSGKAGKLMQMITQLQPMMPLAMQQGYQFDFGQVVALLARFGDIPELARVVKKGPPPGMEGAGQMAQGAAQGGGEPPGMPAITSRTHVRENRPMMTNRGHSQVMQQLLSSGGQPAQRAMIGAAPSR